MFIRCRRICTSRERWEKHHLRYSKFRPRYSDNGRNRPLLGTPSSGGRFRLNIEQRPVASNRSGLVKQRPRAHSTSASKVLDSELPETVDSLLRHPGAVPVSLHFTANTDGSRRSDSSLWCLQDSPKYQNPSKRRWRILHSPTGKNVARTFWLQYYFISFTN